MGYLYFHNLLYNTITADQLVKQESNYIQKIKKISVTLTMAVLLGAVLQFHLIKAIINFILTELYKLFIQNQP